jgi:hypothetical protein
MWMGRIIGYPKLTNWPKSESFSMSFEVDRIRPPRISLPTPEEFDRENAAREKFMEDFIKSF